MTHSHAIVWMDSKEARIFHFNATDVDTERFRAHNEFRQVHHKAGVIGAGRSAMDTAFFDHIIDSLRGTREWLLVGPANGKLALLEHIDKHMPWMRKSLAGVEAMDHPTDGELVDHARRAFKAIDRMLPNTPA